MPVYRVTSDHLDELPQTTFEEVGIKERAGLQRLLREQIEVISPDTLVIAEEFSDWESSNRRIDLLGIDKSANLVVTELKRSQSGEHMELQSLRYAAMVSAMTFERAVEVFGKHLQKLGKDDDPEKSLLSFLDWTEPDEEKFAQDVSIVLASADFSQELTTTVMWLIDHSIDVRCVRLRPYKNGDEVLLDVQQVIPLPEASDYQVKLREKRNEERKSATRTEEVLRSFWTSLLERSRKETQLHANISPTNLNWVSAGSGFGGVGYLCVLNKHRSSLELHIDRGEQKENKEIFDRLLADRKEIEDTFGDSLTWDRQDANRRSLVKHIIMEAGFGDEQQWPEIQERMVNSLVRFEKAFQPKINELRSGKGWASPMASICQEG